MGQQIGTVGRPPKNLTIEQMRLNAEAAQLKVEGKSYRQIAELVGCDVHTAHDRVQRAIAAVPVEAVESMRAIEGARLDEDEARLQKIRNSVHLVVSHGRVVPDPQTGQPMVDDAPVIHATMALLRVRARRAALFNLDIPATQRHEVKVEHTTAADAELERLAQQLGTRALEEGSVARGGEG